VAQFEPAQQGWPLPPQVPHVPLAQTSPETLQVVPQQGWPVPPQALHDPPEHRNPLPHELPPQQG
jgi:hypothetical protein